MDLKQIRRLLGAAHIPDVATTTGLSERTLFRIKAGGDNITLSTLELLQKWAKNTAGHKAPRRKKK